MKYFLALLAALFLNDASAFTVRPVDGLWGIDSEQNLAIGRALNLELSNGLMVATMYTYNSQRAPTFYLATGPLSASNTVAGVFVEPQGGTCLGCAPSSGGLLSTPGAIFLEFTTSTRGYVTLPGESRKAISKGAITRAMAPSGLFGTWVFNYITESLPLIAVADATTLSIVLAPSAFGNGVVASSDGKVMCEYQTSGRYFGSVFCSTFEIPTTYNKFMLATWFDNNMDGLSQYQNLGVNNTFTAKRISNNGNSLGIKTEVTPDMVRLESRRLEFEALSIQMQSQR